MESIKKFIKFMLLVMVSGQILVASDKKPREVPEYLKKKYQDRAEYNVILNDSNKKNKIKYNIAKIAKYLTPKVTDPKTESEEAMYKIIKDFLETFAFPGKTNWNGNNISEFVRDYGKTRHKMRNERGTYILTVAIEMFLELNNDIYNYREKEEYHLGYSVQNTIGSSYKYDMPVDLPSPSMDLLRLVVDNCVNLNQLLGSSSEDVVMTEQNSHKRKLEDGQESEPAEKRQKIDSDNNYKAKKLNELEKFKQHRKDIIKNAKAEYKSICENLEGFIAGLNENIKNIDQELGKFNKNEKSCPVVFEMAKLRYEKKRLEKNVERVESLIEQKAKQLNYYIRRLKNYITGNFILNSLRADEDLNKLFNFGSVNNYFLFDNISENVVNLDRGWLQQNSKKDIAFTGFSNFTISSSGNFVLFFNKDSKANVVLQYNALSHTWKKNNLGQSISGIKEIVIDKSGAYYSVTDFNNTVRKVLLKDDAIKNYKFLWINERDKFIRQDDENNYIFSHPADVNKSAIKIPKKNITDIAGIINGGIFYVYSKQQNKVSFYDLYSYCDGVIHRKFEYVSLGDLTGIVRLSDNIIAINAAAAIYLLNILDFNFKSISKENWRTRNVTAKSMYTIYASNGQANSNPDSNTPLTIEVQTFDNLMPIKYEKYDEIEF